MTDSGKYLPVGGRTLVSDLKAVSPFFRTRRTIAFAYGFMFAFLAFALFLVFNPSSSNSVSPLFPSIFTSSPASRTTTSFTHSYRSHFPSLFYYFSPNFSTPSPRDHKYTAPTPPPPLRSRSDDSAFRFSTTNKEPSGSQNSQPHNGEVQDTNRTTIPITPPTAPDKNPKNSTSPVKRGSGKEGKRVGEEGVVSDFPERPTENGEVRNTNRSSISTLNTPPPPAESETQVKEKGTVSNRAAPLKKQGNVYEEEEKTLEALSKCNLFDGEWVRDESYPLYKPGSCPLIDEQFNCFLNGRSDLDFQKLKWKPKGCTLPRFDGSHMLDLLRGKRLAFVGDSLNRNMWESMVCILRNSVKDQSKVFEASGRHYFRTDASYSFIFQDYNCSVEFFVTPFLVQEWEVSDKSGSKKETLRLDMVEPSSDNYKDADFIIFNTGHWWTHDKTKTGKDYYQEGSHVYDELNVIEAFRRALTTWGRWIDANINPAKGLVFFRGYSASHFSGGQWNSGGQCDSETEPIGNETYLAEYPPKMSMLERVIKGMKTRVTYMNITRMTDYRKDGHPSIYRKQNLSEEERRSPLRFQDCSHWCLPGVPDSWNELFYAELLIKQHQKRKQQQQQKRP